MAVLSGRAAFSVTATGTPPLNYQWRKEGADIIGAASAIYTRPSVQDSDAGRYTVVVGSGADSVESRPATLTVSAAPVITQQPTNQVVFAGINLTFSVVAAGTGPLTFQWFKDGTALTGATNGILALDNILPADAGTYSVTVGSAGGSVVSDLAVLTVQQVVSDARFDPAAGFQFRLTVPEGKRATVQISADLINWVNFTTNPVTGIQDVQDPLATTAEVLFYRIILEP